jgi:HSP90 family molecular chaperone
MALLWRCFVVLIFALTTLSGDVTKEKHDFKSDVSKMLDIIIHSLYTNRNIFLREVISNGSDALDKIRFLYLTNPSDPKNKDDEAPTMDIKISADKEARTLTVRDGGIGMTKEDLINALGSLGSSGTKKFFESLESGASDMNLIGQFGVGFYSVFLVADDVKVATKHDASEVQWVWQSTADGTYELYEDPRGNTLGRGTELTLTLKKDADDYLDPEKLIDIVRQYSEFIHFPIYVQTVKTDTLPPEPIDDTDDEPEGPKEGEDEEEEKAPGPREVTTTDWKLVNENKPIWTRKPTEIEKEEYFNFYKAISRDYDEPLWYTHFNAEGEVEFKSILYIPKKSPANVFEAGSTHMTNIRLYVRRVFITDEFKDLLPRYLNFIKGVVDSDDLPLNVSRELLQESRILKIIKKKLIRKALSMLKDMADHDETKPSKEEEDTEPTKDDDDEEASAMDTDKKGGPVYPKFWEEFGKSIRLGLIEDSTNRARLTKLLRYKSSKSEDKYISLEDYVDRMPDDQKNIFFITGESMERIKESPMLEQATAQGVEVLYMTDAIDEYVVGHLTEFSGKKLVSLAKEGVKLKEESETEKKVAEKRKKAWEPFLKWLKKVLGERIERATLSTRVNTSPCVLVSPQYGLTANMERIIKGQALSDAQRETVAKRVMEVNPRHPIVDELRRRAKEDPEDSVAKENAILMYEVAALRSGFFLDDTASFADRMHKSMKTAMNLEPEAGLVEEEEYTLDDDDDTTDGDDDEDDDNEADDDDEDDAKDPGAPPSSGAEDEL